MVVVTNNSIANLVNMGSLILVTIILTILIIIIINAIIEDIEFACEMRHKKKEFWSEEKVQQRNTQKQIDLLETENQKLINRISELEKENKDLKEDLKW